MIIVDCSALLTSRGGCIVKSQAVRPSVDWRDLVSYPWVARVVRPVSCLRALRVESEYWVVPRLPSSYAAAASAAAFGAFHSSGL